MISVFHAGHIPPYVVILIGWRIPVIIDFGCRILSVHIRHQAVVAIGIPYEAWRGTHVVHILLRIIDDTEVVVCIVRI